MIVATWPGQRIRIRIATELAAVDATTITVVAVRATRPDGTVADWVLTPLGGATSTACDVEIVTSGTDVSIPGDYVVSTWCYTGGPGARVLAFAPSPAVLWSALPAPHTPPTAPP